MLFFLNAKFELAWSSSLARTETCCSREISVLFVASPISVYVECGRSFQVTCLSYRDESNSWLLRPPSRNTSASLLEQGADMTRCLDSNNPGALHTVLFKPPVLAFYRKEERQRGRGNES